MCVWVVFFFCRKMFGFDCQNIYEPKGNLRRKQKTVLSTAWRGLIYTASGVFSALFVTSIPARGHGCSAGGTFLFLSSLGVENRAWGLSGWASRPTASSTGVYCEECCSSSFTFKTGNGSHPPVDGLTSIVSHVNQVIAPVSLNMYVADGTGFYP